MVMERNFKLASNINLDSYQPGIWPVKATISLGMLAWKEQPRNGGWLNNTQVCNSFWQTGCHTKCRMNCYKSSVSVPQLRNLVIPKSIIAIMGSSLVVYIIVAERNNWPSINQQPFNLGSSLSRLQISSTNLDDANLSTVGARQADC